MPEEENAEEEEEEDAPLPWQISIATTPTTQRRVRPDERDETTRCVRCARDLVDLADLNRPPRTSTPARRGRALGRARTGTRQSGRGRPGDGTGRRSDPAPRRDRAARRAARWWRGARRGPTEFAEAAVRATRLAALDLLGDADLRTMGIDTLGARKRILAAIAARRETEPAGMAGMARTVGTVGTMGTRASPSPGTMVANPAPASGWHPTRSAETVAPVFARAKAGADLRDSPPRPQGRPAGTTGTVGTGMMGSTGSTGTIRARSSRDLRDAAWDGRAFGRPSRSGPPLRLGSASRHCSSWTTRARQVALRLVSPPVSHALARHHYVFDKVHARSWLWYGVLGQPLSSAAEIMQRERLRVVDVGRPFRVDGVSRVFSTPITAPAVMVLDDIPAGADRPRHRDSLPRRHVRKPTLPRASRAPALMLDDALRPEVRLPAPRRAGVRDRQADKFNPAYFFLARHLGKERVFFAGARWGRSACGCKNARY